MPSKFTLSKKERLKSKKSIAKLFASNVDIYKYPIKVLYSIGPLTVTPLQFAVSVPKRKFKKAVDRNLIKRRIREAYRIHKIPLQDQIINEERSLILMFIYVSQKIEPFEIIEKSTINLLEKINERIQTDT